MEYGDGEMKLEQMQIVTAIPVLDMFMLYRPVY